MSDDLIASVNASSPPASPSTNRKRKRPRNRNFDAVANEISGNFIEPETLMNNLNENVNNSATMIIADASEKKRNSYEVLSKSSGVAKSILKDIVDDKDSIKLTTSKAVNVLRLLTNIYDNNFQ
ncbi:P12 [Perigonia lusca single nucleopolyhedrovirus]|uniref:p12 n=1 Tax=Perigonia lusca single nucleopolyhedrovirus TaxID=1675865 RepID=A0A0M3N132_9ABAC|nr:P12 [Perigonia lusca single nucleopolyhedrovirus]AKN80663.1 P12 [Perigonia lusca single nucleopolyhedrovirus]